MSLLLVQYKTRSCLVARMHQSFECLTHGPLHHACMKPSRLTREGEIEMTKACGMEGADEWNEAGKTCEEGNQTWPQCTTWCRMGLRTARAGQPITPLDANLYRQPANGIPVINHSYINNGANSKTKLIHPEHTYECGNSCQLREKYVQGTLATYGLHSAETS